MKKIIVVLGLVLLLSITGCVEVHTNVIDIQGRVITELNTPLEGVIVKASGHKVETNSLGYFKLTLYLDGPQYIDFTFDATNHDRGQLTMTQKIYPDRDFDLGYVQISRDKALIHGTVTYPQIYKIDTLSQEPPSLLTTKGPSYVEDEIIVRIAGPEQIDSLKSDLAELNMELISITPGKRFIILKTKNDISTSIAKLEERPEIRYAEPNYYLYSQSYSGYERDYDQQWNLNAINMANVNKHYSINCSNIDIAVLDTGINATYADNHPNILTDLGYDYVNDDPDPTTYTHNSHGTQVTSIINLVTAETANIIPFRILSSVENDTAQGKTSELLVALEDAVGLGVDIINLSIAINTPDNDVQSVQEMISIVENNGALVVAAAGNESKSNPEYPASDWRILSVGAVGPTLRPASYTNKGVDIYAPGGDYNMYPSGTANTIWTEDGWAEGTSLASAHVAGIAAIAISNDDSLETPADIRYRLTSTSLLAAYKEEIGLIDGFRAVSGIKHGRIFVAIADENQKTLEYWPKESTYTYLKNGEYSYEIANVEPGDRCLLAWVDRDANGVLSSNDLFVKEKRYDIEGGDIIEVNLELETFNK